MTEEINVVAGLVKACVKENASAVQSQEEYAKKYNGLLARYEKATARVKELAAEKERKQSRERDLRLFIVSLKNNLSPSKNGTKGCGWRSSTGSRSTVTAG